MPKTLKSDNVTSFLSLVLKNGNNGKRGVCEIGVVFRNKQQFDLMNDESFEKLFFIINKIIPEEYFLDDFPLSIKVENSNDVHDSKIHLLLTKTKTYIGSSSNNHRYHDTKIEGHEIVSVIKEEDINIKEDEEYTDEDEAKEKKEEDKDSLPYDIEKNIEESDPEHHSENKPL